MNAEQIELAAAIVLGVPSLPRAACKDRAELFDADDDDSALEALSICESCPELAPCREYAGTLKCSEAHGVIGGQHRPWASHSSLQRRHPVTIPEKLGAR